MEYYNSRGSHLLPARIYTIAVESMDWMLLNNFLISCLLSSSVLVAAIYFKKDKEAPKKKE